MEIAEVRRSEEGRIVLADREEVKEYRKARRMKKNRTKHKELIGIANREIHIEKAKPQTMICRGVRTANRKEFIKEAVRYGKDKHTDPDNNTKAQKERLERLRQTRINERMNGRKRKGIEVFDVLLARAKTKMNIAADLENTVPEIVKALPFDTCRKITKQFNNIFHEEEENPEKWEMTEYGAIPKDANTETMQGSRWIAKINHFRQWYIRSWRDRLDTGRVKNVNTYGFQPGHNTKDITGMIREMLRLAAKWGYPLIVISADILTAFDRMIHEVIDESLAYSNVDIDTRIAVMNDYRQKKARIRINGAGTTWSFRISKAGYQGGAKTNKEWNRMMEMLMEPLVEIWDILDYGFETKPTKGLPTVRITHAIWADNIFLFAKSKDEAQYMIDGVTDRIKGMGLEWKVRNSDGSNALEVMTAGEIKEEEIKLRSRTGTGEKVEVEQKKELKLLGVALDQEGNSYKCMRFRMRQAEKTFWKYARVFKGKGMVGDLLKAWDQAVVGTGVFGAGEYTLSYSMLKTIRGWELHCLRKILRRTFRWNEDRTKLMKNPTKAI